MDQRISTLAATVVLATLPLLAACGGGTSEGSAASASAPATSTEPSTAPSPTPTFDEAEAKEQAGDATEKFVKTALTIGYPDKSYDAYLDRVRPLVTDDGFAKVKTASSSAGEKTIKNLYNAKARSLPKLTSDVTVSDLSQDGAKAKVTYKLQGQLRQGGDWKTLNTESEQTAKVTLVDQDGTWLVDDVS